jgi:hypothetical protein
MIPQMPGRNRKAAIGSSHVGSIARNRVLSRSCVASVTARRRVEAGACDD